MIKHLTKHGNSLALVIDRPILKLLGIGARTPVAITTDGERLFVTAARNAKREKAFRAAVEQGRQRHGQILHRLAAETSAREAVEFHAALAKVNKRYGPALKRLAE